MMDTALILRDLQRLTQIAGRISRFDEKDGLIRQGVIQFGSMGGVVTPDTENFANRWGVRLAIKFGGKHNG